MPPHWISWHQFRGLMSYLKPRNGMLQNYLVFKSLKADARNGLSLDDFYDVYEKKEFHWKRVSELDNLWFSCLKDKPRPICFVYNLLKGVNWLVTSKGFDIFIYVAIIANGCTFIYEILTLSKTPAEEREREAFQNHWYNVLFIAIYGTEALLKLIGLGVKRYFSCRFNCFDFIVTVLGITGLIGAAAKSLKKLSFIVCIRPLRLLLLFKLKRRFRDVLKTMWMLTPRMFRMMLVIVCIYYSFGIIGMECFAGLKLKDCCKNTSVAQSFKEGARGYYYLNNFDDLIHAMVTLFVLTVVNNWFIIMEGVVHLTSDWSRLYFMLFYIITMVVMTIVVAFIVAAFLFRIQYRKEHQNDDEEIDMSIVEIEVQFEELLSLGEEYVKDLQAGQTLRYRGKRLMTKMELSTRMYSSEVEEWKREERVFNIHRRTDSV